MSSSHHYKEIENQIVKKTKINFYTIIDKIAAFFHKGHKAITIMIIPHSGKKIAQTKFSYFLFIFIAFLVGAMLTCIVVFSIKITYTKKYLQEKTNDLDITKRKIELLLDETITLKSISSSFETSLEETIGNFHMKKTNNKNNNLTIEDLIPHEYIDKKQNSVIREIERLKKIRVTMEKSMKAMKEISDIMVNQSLILEDMPTLWPVENGEGRITLRFGISEHPFTKQCYLHKGLDIGYGLGKPLIAAGNGKVVSKRFDPIYGNNIVIRHSFGFESKYGHMQKVFVDIGDIVKQGQKIGTMGSTGLSTGPHLHFEIKIGSQVVDPERFITIRKKVQ